jgi:ribosomal protein L36
LMAASACRHCAPAPDGRCLPSQRCAGCRLVRRRPAAAMLCQFPRDRDSRGA